MADLSEIEAAVVALAAAGVAACGPAPPRVYRGWPASGALDADLAAGLVHVTVFPVPGASQNTTRWGVFETAVAVPPWLTVSVVGNEASFGGAAPQGQIAGVLVEGVPFVYAAGARDTPASVASVLAADIRALTRCDLSGSSLTVPAVRSIVARTSGLSPNVTEYGRQSQSLRVVVWAPSFKLRDQVSGMLGACFASTPFLALEDGEAARLRYRSTASIDDGVAAGLYRRDIVVDAEYATTFRAMLPAMLFGDLRLSGTDTYV